MTWTFGRIGVPTPSVFTDDFERADGTLDDNGWIPYGIYPVGQTIANSTRHLQLVSGRATLALTGAGYAIRTHRGLSKITVSCRWATGSTDGSFVGVVCSRQPVSVGLPAIGVNSVHNAIGRLGRNLNLYNGSLSAAVDTDTYTIATGTDVTFSIEWDGANTVTITDVDGGTETYTSATVGALWGDTIYIEVINADASTDRIASINSVTLEGDSTIVLEGHEPFQWDGEAFSVTADLPAPTIEAAVALREQFNGYDLNPDENRIPITSTEDDSLNFFATINSVTVDDHVSTYIEGGLGSKVTIEGVKVSGAGAPLVEISRNGTLRSNVHTYTDDISVTGLPGGFKTPRFTVAQDFQRSVPVESGSVQVYADAVSKMSVTYGIVPDSFYEGAATIEVSYDLGATWFPVIGRQVRNLPGGVRLSNGRVRVTCSISGGSTLLTTEAWDATLSQWERCNFQVVDTAITTSVTTYSDPGIAFPRGICLGPDGNLWFTSNNSIGRITPSGAVTVFTDPSINSARGICLGPDGNLWFTSYGNNKIGRITPTGVVTMFTGTDVAGPLGICSDGTDLWFTSQNNDRIGRCTTAGTITTYADASLSVPYGICLGPDGLLWIASNGNDKIVKATNANPPVFTAYTTGVGNAPYQICSGPDGLLWYTRYDDDAVCKITTTGTVTTYTSGVPDQPFGICSDGTALWVAYRSGVAKVTTAGVVTAYADSNVSEGQGIALGPHGNLWFASALNNRIGVLIPATSGVEFGGTLTILRNSPEACGIQMGAADGPEQLSLSLRRGANFFEGDMQSTVASTYGIYRTESETGANVGAYGVKANAANAYGNKYTMLSPQAVTQDSTGVSGLYLTGSATAFRFAFSPVNDDTVEGGATMEQAYFAAVEEKQKVNAR